MLTTGLVQKDKTCGYNDITCGAISNLTYAIDNQLGGPLRIGNLPIGGVQFIFANPKANDARWGGCGVTLASAGQYYTHFSPGNMPKSNVWIMNKSGQPQWVSIFGSNENDPFEVRIREWHDFSTPGVTISKSAPCGFILQSGEKISYTQTGNKKYAWAWRPLL